jgi:hypothetical protein
LKAVQEACQKLPAETSSPAEAALVRATAAQMAGYLENIMNILQPYGTEVADVGVMRGNALKSWRMILVALNDFVSHLLTFLSRSLAVLAKELPSRHPPRLVCAVWLLVTQMLCALVKFGLHFETSTDAEGRQPATGSCLLMQQLQPADDLFKPGEWCIT